MAIKNRWNVFKDIIGHLPGQIMKMLEETLKQKRKILLP